MMRPRLQLFALAAAFALSGVALASPSGDTYTLYRNSALDTKGRLHVATFDAVDGAAYNRENCDQARKLFQAQPGVKTRFWCEPGRFQAAAGPDQPKLSPQFTTGTSVERTCSPSAAEIAKPPGSRKPIDYRCER